MKLDIIIIWLVGEKRLNMKSRIYNINTVTLIVNLLTFSTLKNSKLQRKSTYLINRAIVYMMKTLESTKTCQKKSYKKITSTMQISTHIYNTHGSDWKLDFLVFAN